MMSLRIKYYNFKFLLLKLVALKSFLKNLCLSFFLWKFQLWTLNKIVNCICYAIKPTALLASNVFLFLNSFVLNCKVVLIDDLEVVECGDFFFFCREEVFWTSSSSIQYIEVLYIISCFVNLFKCFLKSTRKVVRKLNLAILRVLKHTFTIDLQNQNFFKFFFIIYTYGSNKNNILYFSSRRSEIDRCRFSYNRFSRSWCWYWYRVCRFNSRFIKKSTLFRFIISLCYFRICFNGSNGSIGHYDGVLDFEQLDCSFRFISLLEHLSIKVFFPFSLSEEEELNECCGSYCFLFYLNQAFLTKKEQWLNFLKKINNQVYDE